MDEWHTSRGHGSLNQVVGWLSNDPVEDRYSSSAIGPGRPARVRHRDSAWSGSFVACQQGTDADEGVAQTEAVPCLFWCLRQAGVAGVSHSSASALLMTNPPLTFIPITRRWTPVMAATFVRVVPSTEMGLLRRTEYEGRIQPAARGHQSRCAAGSRRHHRRQYSYRHAHCGTSAVPPGGGRSCTVPVVQPIGHAAAAGLQGHRASGADGPVNGRAAALGEPLRGRGIAGAGGEEVVNGLLDTALASAGVLKALARPAAYGLRQARPRSRSTR